MLPYEIYVNEYNGAIVKCNQSDLKEVEMSLLNKGYVILHAYMLVGQIVFIEVTQLDTLP